MTIKQFIEAAIEGGWENKELPTISTEQSSMGEVITAMYWRKMLPVIALDPGAWKAVGKVKGWPEGYEIEFAGNMIRALWAGKTLEEYIATL